MIRGLAKGEHPGIGATGAGSMPRAVILLVVAIFMTSACTSEGSPPRQVAVTPIDGSLEAPRMSVPLRSHICPETAETFGFSPGEACFSDSYSLFVHWPAFSNPRCVADESVHVRVARHEQIESPDRFVVVDLLTTEDCSDPVDGLAAVVALRSDELGRGRVKATTPALVGRLAIDGSIVGAPFLLVSDMRGDAMLPMEVPWYLDGEAEE